MRINIVLTGVIIILSITTAYLRYNLTKQENKSLELIDQNINLKKEVNSLKIENSEVNRKLSRERLTRRKDSIKREIYKAPN